MNLSFQKAGWIWENAAPRPDEYAEFCADFVSREGDAVQLAISADSDYAVYCNGALAGFGQYACYPDEKYGDALDLSAWTHTGENTLAIVVWYYGKAGMTYTVGQAGVIFEVTAGDRVLVFSSEQTRSRPAFGYVPHKVKNITSQLGLTYEYDATAAEAPASPSVAVPTLPMQIRTRPIQKTVLRARCPSERAIAGGFLRMSKTGEPAEDMTAAALTFARASREERRGGAFTVEAGETEGCFFIVDLTEETCGFLNFELTVPTACRIEIAYGEHLQDGRVRTYKRNYTCVYHAAAGKNTFLNPFRRFGCRYLQFFVYAARVEVAYAGIRPVEYPVTNRLRPTGNTLRDAIEEACVRTLKLCMHEHYEDCPWREQALYAMDSRNQALCGYIAFGETAFPRASWRLMASHPRADGLLSLCAPGGDDAPIPSFSCAYFLGMRDYLEASGDDSLAREMYPTMQRLMRVFLSRRQENGLCLNFYAAEHSDYWNFYEWSETMSGRFGETEPCFEAPLNAFVSLALQALSEMAAHLGKSDDASFYAEQALSLNRAIADAFYRASDGLFDSFLGHDAGRYSVLTNALCLLCGAAKDLDSSVIETILAENGAAETGLSVIPNTLSMNLYRFDALLKVDTPRYAKRILSELDRTYLSMLRRGATTFWETAGGADSFDGAGSLCHGWSALPIYYYHRLSAYAGG